MTRSVKKFFALWCLDFEEAVFIAWKLWTEVFETAYNSSSPAAIWCCEERQKMAPHAQVLKEIMWQIHLHCWIQFRLNPQTSELLLKAFSSWSESIWGSSKSFLLKSDFELHCRHLADIFIHNYLRWEKLQNKLDSFHHQGAAESRLMSEIRLLGEISLQVLLDHLAKDKFWGN